MGDFADDACNRELDDWLYDMEEDREESNTDREFADSFPYGRKNKLSGPGPCPVCGRDTVERQGKFGLFYGCPTFPDCRGTRNA